MIFEAPAFAVIVYQACLLVPHQSTKIMQTATMTPLQSINFLKLPLELREEVYDYIFQTTSLHDVGPWIVSCRWRFRFTIFQFPLASTCRQIRDELLAAVTRLDLRFEHPVDYPFRRLIFIFSTTMQEQEIDTKPSISLVLTPTQLEQHERSICKG